MAPRLLWYTKLRFTIPWMHNYLYLRLIISTELKVIHKYTNFKCNLSSVHKLVVGLKPGTLLNYVCVTFHFLWALPVHSWCPNLNSLAFSKQNYQQSYLSLTKSLWWNHSAVCSIKYMEVKLSLNSNTNPSKISKLWMQSIKIPSACSLTQIWHNLEFYHLAIIYAIFCEQYHILGQKDVNIKKHVFRIFNRIV